MTEIDVALTDYLLGLESAWFAIVLAREGRDAPAVRYFSLAFAGLALAALLGGTSHGFFNTATGPVHFIWWWTTLLAIGMAATGFALAGLLLLGMRPAPGYQRLSLGLFLLYAAVTFLRPDFLFAILFYLPALFICLAGFVICNRRAAGRAAASGITGILLVLLASAGQQLGIGLQAISLSHNALYHLLLMPALWLIFRSARSLSQACAPASED